MISNDIHTESLDQYKIKLLEQECSKIEKKIDFFNPSKYDDLFEKYKTISKLYRLKKDNISSEKYLLNCINCLKKMKYDSFVYSEIYYELAKVNLTIDEKKSIQYYELTLQYILEDISRSSKLVQILDEVSELYKKNFQYDKVLEKYQKAYDICIATDRKVQAEKYIIKIAELYIEINKIDMAYKTYEEYFNFDTSRNPILMTANIFMSLLCQIYLSISNCTINTLDEDVQEKILDKYPAFENTLQYKFISEIINIINNNEHNDFETLQIKIKNYNDICKLNNIQIQILSKIKEQMTHVQDDFT